MAWTWRVEKADGESVQLDSEVPEFPAQGDAETWLGEIWHELAEAGADSVTLVEDGRDVYGPMSLHAE